MNILVSDTSSSYEGWLVVRTLKGALDTVGNIDYLIYHKSMESSEDKIRYLTDIYKTMVSCKIIYICNKDKSDKALQMLVTGGLNGRYIDDEFYLESVDSLNILVKDSLAISESTELSSSAVLNDFFTRYMSDGSQGISKGYLQVVKNAALDMSSAYHAKNREILEMSESAAEIFSNSVDLISQMREQKEKLENDLRNLKDKKDEIGRLNTQSVTTSSIIYHPRVTYLKNKTIIRVKDLGGCPFLISFLLGFRAYLENKKNVRPKLIVVKGIGKIHKSVYSKFKWVDSENKNDIKNYNGDVVFTNIPSSMVLNNLLDDIGYDTFIVLDMSDNYKEHILNSKGEEFYAVSGGYIIDTLKLPRSKCISSIRNIDKVDICIPYFVDYPSKKDLRVNKYMTACSSLYEMLFLDNK